jgi:hypothetical protein
MEVGVAPLVFVDKELFMARRSQREMKIAVNGSRGFKNLRLFLKEASR